MCKFYKNVMKYGRQIYVIGFLICLTMKKIIFLFLSFLGICKGFAQTDYSGGIPGTTAITAAAIQKLAADTAVKEKPFIKLYPNPVKNKAELEVHGFEPGPVQVQIINSYGKMERNDQRLLANGNETMVLMFSLPAGIYFVVLRQKDKTVKKKMMVQ